MKQEHKEFLDGLRESGEIYMFNAGMYLQEKFGLERKEASSILEEWMKTFSK